MTEEEFLVYLDFLESMSDDEFMVYIQDQLEEE